MGCGPVRIRSPDLLWKCNSRGHHLLLVVSAGTYVPANWQPGRSGLPGRGGTPFALPVSPVRALRSSRAGQRGSFSERAQRIRVLSFGNHPGPVPLVTSRSDLRIPPRTHTNTLRSRRRLDSCRSSRCSSCHGLELLARWRILQRSSPFDPSAPGDPVRRLPADLGSDAAAQHSYLPGCTSPLAPNRPPETHAPVCAHTHASTGSHTRPHPRHIRQLLDTLRLVWSLGRRIVSSSVYLRHIGSSHRKLSAEPSDLCLQKHTHTESAATGLLLLSTKHTQQKHTHSQRCLISCARSTPEHFGRFYGAIQDPFHVNVCSCLRISLLPNLLSQWWPLSVTWSNLHHFIKC